MRILILIFAMGLLQTACTSVEPVMSKAGVMAHPDCAKYSTGLLLLANLDFVSEKVTPVLASV
jgi:hypothetical protein